MNKWNNIYKCFMQINTLKLSELHVSSQSCPMNHHLLGFRFSAEASPVYWLIHSRRVIRMLKMMVLMKITLRPRMVKDIRFTFSSGIKLSIHSVWFLPSSHAFPPSAGKITWLYRSKIGDIATGFELLNSSLYVLWLVVPLCLLNPVARHAEFSPSPTLK